MDFKTRCARGQCREFSIGRPVSPPVVMSSTFTFGSLDEIDSYYGTGEGYLYSRYGNPTVRAAEELLAGLEGAEDAAMFASGMAAISTVLLTMAGSGDEVAAQRGLYGGTSHLLSRVLPDLGIATRWLDLEEIERLTPEMIAGCKLLYLETPTNPTLRVVDLERASRAAREAGVPAVVDSTFGTPAVQRPLELGCQVVVHSCTKFLGGHGDLLGGAAAADSKTVERIAERRRSLGGTMDPMTAFLLHRGLLTLAVRMEAHHRGAAAVAEALRSHPEVREVHWPGFRDAPGHDVACRQMQGFGGIVTFRVEGGYEAARRVHDSLELFARAGSLGGVESLVSLPTKMSHRGIDAAELERVGVTPDMLRLSIGLESPEDLIEDLRRALERTDG